MSVLLKCVVHIQIVWGEQVEGSKCQSRNATRLFVNEKDGLVEETN